MSYLKKNLFFYLYILIILELVSFFVYKLNLLEISHKPKLYMTDNYMPNYEWWTEEKEWGSWHKVNAKTKQKKSCFNVTYKSNEVGARDRTFNDNKEDDILLIGDSFAEGYGVNYKDSSQKILEENIDVNILNFGVSKNFGPVQYYLIYKNLAKNYKFNKIIIYLLPDNDFGDNDYNNWSGSKRYRPYYTKLNGFDYDFFIPVEAKKNYLSSTKKIKIIFKNYFWSSGLFINLNYQYKIYRAKRKNSIEFSSYFDTPLEQQKAAIYFIEKIINDTNSDVFLVSIPRPQDFKKNKIQNNLDKVYWNKYFVNKDKNKSNFTFIDLIKFPPANISNLYLKCDGHWSPEGNKWAAEIISSFIKKN